MTTHIDEFPKQPFPHVPPPMEPPRPAPAPTVFVYETPGWEYKVIARDTRTEKALTEDELNELGKDGWELAGVLPLPPAVRFYLKRVRR